MFHSLTVDLSSDYLCLHNRDDQQLSSSFGGADSAEYPNDPNASVQANGGVERAPSWQLGSKASYFESSPVSNWPRSP